MHLIDYNILKNLKYKIVTLKFFYFIHVHAYAPIIMPEINNMYIRYIKYNAVVKIIAVLRYTLHR